MLLRSFCENRPIPIVTGIYIEFQDQLIHLVFCGSQSFSPPFLFLQLTVNPDERITASEALGHDWITQGDYVPTLHRRTTFGRLAAFNARRKLRGVVLGLIARKRYQ